MFVSRVIVALRVPSPEKKVSRENYEPCPQLSHGRSLYYGQTGSRVAQFWSYYLQPELPVYVLLTLFPRVCRSVHSTHSNSYLKNILLLKIIYSDELQKLKKAIKHAILAPFRTLS